MAISSAEEDWSSDIKPNDIDIDVFYIGTPIMPDSEYDSHSSYNDVIIRVVKCFFVQCNEDDIINRIRQSFLNRDAEAEVIREGNEKIILGFEKLNKRIMFGTVTDRPYHRILLKYYDTDGKNLIDFFIDGVDLREFTNIEEHITEITLSGYHINILSLNDIISRYKSIFTNPDKKRLEKLPDTLTRFVSFLDQSTGHLSAEAKMKIIDLINFLEIQTNHILVVIY